MESKMWLKSDKLRVGFVCKFRNGFKVVVEYLRSEKVGPIDPVVERKEYIKGISWEAIMGFMDESSNMEGEDVGSVFDVFVYNSGGKQIRLPMWDKKEEYLIGVTLEEVINVLFYVKGIRSMKV